MKASEISPIYLTKHGSQAYGLDTEESDLDIKGVFIAPKEYYLGFLKTVEQVEGSEHATFIDRPPGQIDSVIYELRKFFKMATDCNPNIIEVLYTDREDIIKIDKYGEILRDNRNLFLSQKAKHTFSGYAHQQLKRIRGHYRWLKNPPKKKPERKDYNLPENESLLPDHELEAIRAAIKKQIDTWQLDMEDMSEAGKIDLQQKLDKYMMDLKITTDEDLEIAAARTIGLSENIIEAMQRERKYKTAMIEWKQYQNWKENRNPKRAELESRYGYDTKHAMHLVRLMRMGEEILTTGQVNVKRPDRDELLAIRNEGIWSYEYLVDWAEQMDQKLTEMYNSKKSTLPHKPKRNELDKLCVEMVESYHEDCSDKQLPKRSTKHYASQLVE